MITIKKRKSKKYLEKTTQVEKKYVTDTMWSEIPVLMWSKYNTLRKCK